MNNSLPAFALGGGLANTAPPQQQPSPPKKASKKSQKAAQNQTAPSTATPVASAKQSKSKAAKASTNATSPAAEKPTTASGNDATTPTPTPTAKAKKDTDTAAKKHAAKPQSFKITREKERKEKQQKQAAALAPPAAVDAHAEPDAVKSRNHRLFLAPPTLARSSRDPCWTVRRASASLGGGANVDSVADRLHDEILEYAHYTRVTVEAMAVHIEQMIAHVGRCVHALWPKSTMEPFGSYSTGIWLPSSDVDLVILGVVEIHDRSLTVKSLRQLARALEKQPWVESLVVLDTAKIPVLKLVTAQSSVPIDITFESSATHSGLLARDLIKRYADEMPELYPLAVVFKQLLRERDLNDAYTGGLSSYSIVLMIIHFQLLWRYGERCFRAAALFASGSPLPRPADLLAEEERQKKREEALAQQKALEAQQVPQSAWGPKKSAAAAVPTITSSFASVVARPKSLKRPASEAGKSGASDDGTTKPVAPAQPFSYAAVAAGIVKLSTEEPGKAAPTVPSSYAAAVAAPAQPAKAKAKAASKKGDALDAVSVTSSTADTEDCSDGSSSTTTSAHEDADHASSSAVGQQQDVAAAQQQPQEEPVEMSLGERTMTILEFYGILFDYRKNGLSIRDGGYIYRLAEHVGSIPGDLSKKLVIEDPIHPDRNVSASSFAFSKVVAVFEDSFYALKYFRPSRFTPSALSCLLSTSGHSLHQYQQQFHHLLAGKSTTAKTPVAASTAKPTSAVPQPHKGVAIAAK